MEDNLIKPDVVLVTKNVMVPLALPAPRNKFIVDTSVLKRKKTKIVKARKNKALTRQNLPFTENDDCKSLRSNNGTEKIPCSDNTRIRYDSSLNYDPESEEICENRYNPEFVLSRELASEPKIAQKISSSSFSVIAVPKEVPKFSCKPEITQKISSPSFSVIAVPEEVPKFSCEPKITQKISSPSFPMVAVPEEVPKFSCEMILLPKSFDPKEREIERNLDEVELHFEGSKEEENKNSAMKIRCCASSDVIFKFGDTPTSRADKEIDNDKCEIKYSWEDLDNWIPPSEKKKILESNEKKSEESIIEKRLDCRIKYSWQIVGTGVQTSDSMINYLPSKEDEPAQIRNYPCSIKYSWQIIGTGTQVSFEENTRDSSKYETDYWHGKILKAKKRSLDQTTRVDRSGKCKILYNEKTQTMADKIHQTDTTDCRVKYSWQNLTRAYLVSTKYPCEYPS